MYTSLTYEDIKKLTILQYQDLIGVIATQQALDLQTNSFAMTGSFDEDTNPLYVIQPEEEDSSPKMMTVEQAQELASLLN